MSKKDVITVSVIATIGAGIAGGLYLWNKKKNQKPCSINTNCECEECECENSSDEPIDIEECVEEDEEISTDDIVPEISTREDDIEKETIVHKFIAYLVKNGVDSEEVISICETITRIRYDLPDQFCDVKKKMLDMMSSKFSINKSHEFDKENFRLMYSSIDPCQLFIKNGFKILTMGPDYQTNMMELAEALTELQEKNPDEAMTVMYELYHIFNELETDDITDSTYDEKFKSYVEKYVKDENLEEVEDSNFINESGKKVQEDLKTEIETNAKEE